MKDFSFKISPVDIEARAAADVRSGNTVRVWQKIEEKGKTRLQAFEGLVIARKHGSEAGGTFTVRKISSGVGVEKIFPLYSPVIERIEILRRAKTRRSKLYYIRDKSAKQVRHKTKQLGDFVAGVMMDKPEQEEAQAEPEAEVKAE
jgi:large subunit ribosomal protein L19